MVSEREEGKKDEGMEGGKEIKMEEKTAYRKIKVITLALPDFLSLSYPHHFILFSKLCLYKDNLPLFSPCFYSIINYGSESIFSDIVKVLFSEEKNKR
jgi:hypothetical protein